MAEIYQRHLHQSPNGSCSWQIIVVENFTSQYRADIKAQSFKRIEYIKINKNLCEKFDESSRDRCFFISIVDNSFRDTFNLSFKTLLSSIFCSFCPSLFVEKSIRVAKNIQCYNLIYVILTKNVRAFIRLISISTLGFQGGEARENMEKSHGRERAIDHTTLDTFVFAYNERSRNDCTSRAKFLARHERNKSRPLESYLPMHETEELSAAMFQLYYIASSRSVSILQLSRRCNRVFARKQLKKTTLVNC